MKNSTKTYLLLFAVLSIWGTIAFKAIAGLKPNALSAKEEVRATFFKPVKLLEMDSFSIQILERDPFLGTLKKARKKNKNKEQKSLKKTEKNDEIPTISFVGLIQNQVTDKEVFIVEIDKKQYLIKQGDTIGNVKLIKGYSDKIVVRNQHRRQVIHKS